ncbi:uncharacterized protein LOC120131539 [Hibiscus syriacus]|uniref:uncharacterized protein LOC120131539 n=1 Tax=Hibiscus syriacus TaxID=106335 RepID=UPI001924CF43|nr:uncharacterized protein LOC120131539 [Hibiscus syriacus]
MALLKYLGLSEKFRGKIEACLTTSRWQGIRQGDPLFPYLFVLVMNVLSKLLDLAAARNFFQFYPKCKKVSLTNLSFVDDLLIFCKGLLDSIIGVKCILKNFYVWYGLKINVAKSEFFASGVSVNSLAVIQSLLGFKLGHLPARYVGAPLVTRKLSKKDCYPLIEKLRQLILPQSIIKHIEQLCVGYLLTLLQHVLRFSWERTCSPKFEGRLGLRDLKTWSKGYLFSLAKDILAGQGSLWVAWFHAFVFKGVGFWQIIPNPHFSWCKRTMSKTREESFVVLGAIVGWSEVTTSWIWSELAILGRFSTNDCLLRWGVVVLRNTTIE